MKMNFRYKKWLIPIAAIVFYSCTKVIDVNLNDASPQIVIEGNITDSAGPYQVQITRTVAFNTTNVFPAVSGAVVKIIDSSTGATDILTETSAGIYKTKTITGKYGHTYLLNVTAAGQTYTASSTMPQLTKLDSITFQHLNAFGRNTINPVANFQDSAGVSNYYTFTQFVNNKRLKTIFPMNDRLSDGRYISQQIFSDSSYINVGDTVVLQMNCVDKNVWNYFNTLGQATGNDFQNVTPANPISNISNNALGYFSATTVMSRKKVAK